MRWTPEFAFALGWSVRGAVGRRDQPALLAAAARGGSRTSPRLFYLVPAVTALMAWLMFGETLDALAIAGMVLITAGVALARQIVAPRPEDSGGDPAG